VEDVGEVGSLEENCHEVDEDRPPKLGVLLNTSGATTTAPGLIIGRLELW